MIKKLIILLLVVAPIAAVAQNAKLAHINTQEIFSQMPEIPGIETQLNKFFWSFYLILNDILSQKT